MSELRPARRLSSKTLAQALKTFVVPVVARSYSIVSLRALWNVHQRDEGKAESLIALKRRQLEMLLQRNDSIIVIWSCITGIEKRKSRGKTESDQSHEGQQLMGTADILEETQETERDDCENSQAKPDVVPLDVKPGISFWIVVDVPSSNIKTIENQIQQLILTSGLDLECKPIRARACEETNSYYASTLCTVIKDHNLGYAMNLASKGAYEYTKTVIHAQTGISVDNEKIPKNAQFGTKTVRVTVTGSCGQEFRTAFLAALDKIKYTKFDYDLVDLREDNASMTSASSSVGLYCKPKSNICRAVDMIRRSMEKLTMRLHRGFVYRKVNEAKYTFVKAGTVHEFVHALLRNSEVADVVTPNLQAVIGLLSFKGCQIVRQMKINYNLIEVKPFGVCFNFATKTFHTESIGEEEIGNVSPRTYVSYTYKEGIVPAPKIFIDSLQNSFSEHDVLQRFLQKWYQLALKDCFPQKAKKLCCVGEADSGKTSWFAPYEGIISREKLASVTRDRHFSASMLSDDTECLIVDEWPPDALSADDAKRILQGGYVALPQKHKEATHVVYRSGVYITCNSIPSFTEIDDAAIQTRLAVFKTRSLKERNPQATNYLRKNCMQCFHWCANELRDTPLWEVEEIERAEQQHDDEGAIFNDFNEGQSSRMINIEEIEKLQFSQSIIIANDEATVEHPQGAVPTEIIDQVILDDEDENPNWVREESRCFVTFGPINVFSYHKAVFLLITSKPNWDLLDATDEDLERFQRRRRLSWKKPDSMYDAWLLIEGTPRPEFDIKLFSETFPRWEELLRETYRGISQLSTPINESIDSNNDKTASDDESFFKTQKTPKKRPRTMIVQRRRKHLKLSSDEEE